MKNNEKRKAHYDLNIIKKLISSHSYIVTKRAKDNAREDFNIKAQELYKYILKLENTNLYKSMTSNNNNKIWQDVYHLDISSNNTAYIKLQIVEENTVIIQFKKK